ncbi:RagB/SusD family nutrient uptake outer membrane protein [Mucilaginibacter rubeus]|uniref:RagB/SusD family nutrient uptake outer membrane protein n=1 Tax=Mucilaginibacter rubeus TaxID=2027860 RepID=A0A5C1HX16_9SPHI|nr:RagB/SusD family nutrient uptake outer membrane protein [Mucilaginibacter rubeus]QEM10417.1 RagB/SusD family nutrient uptake outer membrane protein [Mucilaginibacter rubeus]
MKSIYSLLFISLIAVLTFNSCKKSFLDEDVRTQFTPSTLKDALSFEAAVAGLQKTVRDQYEGDQGIIALMQTGTDVARNGQTTAAMAPYETYSQLNSQDVAALGFWRWGYQVINASNVIIQAAQSGNTSLTPAQVNGYVAEARFFRAYAYNFLSTLFGGVPLITVPVTAPKTDYVRTPLDTIINLQVSDLTFAATNLPDAAHVVAEGRINSAAAMQLLAVTYLRANKPDLAEAQLNKIIAGGLYKLVNNRYGINSLKPGDAFSDMFIYGNMRRSQGNTEAIWVIEEANIPGGYSPTDQHRRVWVPFYVNIPGMIVADSLGGRGIGRIRPTNWWTYNLNLSNDMRNSSYNIRRKYYYNDPSSANYGKLAVVTSNTDTIQNMYAHTTKWYSYTNADPFGTITYKDRIYMRLAETYLLLAEAQFKQGNLTAAASNINMLRTRANAPQVQTSDINMDFILDERARELIGEEDRRITLMRTGTLVERVKKYNPTSAGSIKDINMLLPIPQSEIDVNKGAALTQNPGY